MILSIPSHVARLCALLVLLALFSPGFHAEKAEIKPKTLEDLFGTTGNKFAGAIGFQTREANRNPEAIAGYGLGIDDVVVEWREFTLEEDTTDCRSTERYSAPR